MAEEEIRESSDSFTTRGFELVDWQRDAVHRWLEGTDDGDGHGTLEIFTGGGKTLIALQAAAELSRSTPGLRLAVIVPTQALAEQWRTAVERYTDIPAKAIGQLGGGRKGDLHTHRVLVCVLNTAAKRLPEMATTAQPLMLVVDEAHRAGARTFSKVLATPARYRIGLSATPDREDLDEDGEPIAYDEQAVGRALGEVVFRFGLKEARASGWLPDFTIHHHAVQLHPDERRRYEEISRSVDDLADKLREAGIQPAAAMRIRPKNPEHAQVVNAFVGATTKRKDLLYRARERARIATDTVVDLLRNGPRRVLLFGERVEEADAVGARLRAALGPEKVAVEHSRLGIVDRREALDSFRSGERPVLVSVKALVEGIDVPEADAGVAVASSAAVRQRIQSLGRVLRRRFDDVDKQAEMHLIYVHDTVDDLIYGKEDWSDLTGEGSNHYWLWPLDPDQPRERRDGPPRSPRPTEDQEWQRIQSEGRPFPQLWNGLIHGQEYSVNTLGTVTNMSGTVLANPQGVGAMVEAVRGRPGGRFHVTPQHRVVLVAAGGDGGVFAAGLLTEPFQAADAPTGAEVDIESLLPGALYPGPDDDDHGRYRLSQKKGGVLEARRPGGITEFAVTGGGEHPDLEANAGRVLEAWRATGIGKGLEIRVNSVWDAYYFAESQRRYLARVPGGFSWPSASDSDSEYPDPHPQQER